MEVKIVDSYDESLDDNDYNVCHVQAVSGNECGGLIRKPGTLCPLHYYEAHVSVNGSCKYPVSGGMGTQTYHQCDAQPWFEGSKYCLKHRIHGQYEGIGQLVSCTKNGIKGQPCGREQHLLMVSVRLTLHESKKSGNSKMEPSDRCNVNSLNGRCRRSSFDQGYCVWHLYDLTLATNEGCKFPLATSYPADLHNLVQCGKKISGGSRYCPIHSNMGQMKLIDQVETDSE